MWSFWNFRVFILLMTKDRIFWSPFEYLFKIRKNIFIKCFLQFFWQYYKICYCQRWYQTWVLIFSNLFFKFLQISKLNLKQEFLSISFSCKRFWKYFVNFGSVLFFSSKIRMFLFWTHPTLAISVKDPFFAINRQESVGLTKFTFVNWQVSRLSNHLSING